MNKKVIGHTVGSLILAPFIFLLLVIIFEIPIPSFIPSGVISILFFIGIVGGFIAVPLLLLKGFFSDKEGDEKKKPKPNLTLIAGIISCASAWGASMLFSGSSPQGLGGVGHLLLMVLLITTYLVFSITAISLGRVALKEEKAKVYFSWVLVLVGLLLQLITYF